MYQVVNNNNGWLKENIKETLINIFILQYCIGKIITWEHLRGVLYPVPEHLQNLLLCVELGNEGLCPGS